MRFLGMVDQNPSVSKSSRLHVMIFLEFCIVNQSIFLLDSSQRIGTKFSRSFELQPGYSSISTIGSCVTSGRFSPIIGSLNVYMMSILMTPNLCLVIKGPVSLTLMWPIKYVVIRASLGNRVANLFLTYPFGHINLRPPSPTTTFCEHLSLQHINAYKGYSKPHAGL
jgi:hypothetical protein